MLSRTSAFRKLLRSAIAALVVSAVGGSAVPSRVIHERRTNIPRGWSLHERADPGRFFSLSIALTQPNIHNLESYLLDIADPTSPNYGQHWAVSRVAETFRPSRNTVDAVHAWITGGGGIDPTRVRLSKDGGYFDLDLTVAEAEALLATEYYVYRHHDGTQQLACEHGYQLPEHLTKHIDTVWPTIQFEVVPLSRRGAQEGGGGRSSAQAGPAATNPFSAKYATTGAPTGCDQYTSMDCLRALYNFRYDLKVPDKHSIGVVEFGMESLNLKDLDSFFSYFSPSQVGQRPKFVGIDGGISNQSVANADLLVESGLDFQYAMGLLGKKAQVLHYQVTNEGGPTFDYLQFELLLNALDADFCTYQGGNPPWLTKYTPKNEDCGNKPRADVISISYLQTELDFGSFFAQRQCYEYGKLALMGTTFLISSGDTGVAAYGGYCLSEDGSSHEVHGPTFEPLVGNSCPYVTSVGATQVKKGASVTSPNAEEAANIPASAFKSGGGFSNALARPSFQDSAVQHYIDNFTGNLSNTAFNRSGRAYPDVSANGHNYDVVVNQTWYSVFGTSASAPTWAAMIAAVNDARIAAGKKTVGWANPALYSKAFLGVFNDITEGDNFACGPQGNLGFVAAPGWDPVTGLGTPNFKKLLDAWMALP